MLAPEILPKIMKEQLSSLVYSVYPFGPNRVQVELRAVS